METIDSDTGEVLPATVEQKPYVPTLSVDELVNLLEKVEDAKNRVLREGLDKDYAVIPGTGTKPSLLKPGAEKLCQLFGYRIRAMDQVKETDTPYGVGYKCTLHDSQGRIVGVCDGWADKSEPKARTWNKNTVMKMAQKRAFVGATLWACNASAIFTQDVEDYGADDFSSDAYPTMDVTRKVTEQDAGAEAFQKLVEIVEHKLRISFPEAREFMVSVCKDAGYTSTDDLVDPAHLNEVRTKMLDAIDVRLGIEAKQEEPQAKAQTPGSLILKKLIEEFGSKLPQDSIWDVITQGAQIKTVEDLTEDGAYEMCRTLLIERVEDAAKATSSSTPEPGDASKSASTSTSRSRNKTTKENK
jgi:hypothetical protein